MTAISLRMPEDVLDELKEIAPLLGYSGYQPLIRAYIGQGLRKDLSDLLGTPMEVVAENLRKQGISARAGLLSVFLGNPILPAIA